MKHVCLPYTLLFLLTICFKNTHAQKKLVILGSSTAACTGPTNADSCYVSRINKFYRSAGVLDTIVNLAVGGSSVYRGMPSSYVPPLNRAGETPDPLHNITAALAFNPDAILVHYPSNGYDLFSVSEVMYCLRTIKQAANGAGKPCYVATTQPRSAPSSFLTAETRRKMAAIKDSVLNEFGPAAINFWDGIVNPADSTILPVFSSGDGIHLNNAGHGILAQRIQQKNIFTVGAALPVRFIAFTAVSKNEEVALSWITAFEEGIKHYEIQRSEEGLRFLRIHTVEAGSPSQQGHYSFIERKPSGTATYYRVSAVSNDEKPVLSNVVRVAFNEHSFIIQKLSRRNGTILLEVQSPDQQKIRIQVINNAGQLLMQKSAMVSRGTTAIPLNFLSPRRGSYYVSIRDSRNNEKVKTFAGEP